MTSHLIKQPNALLLMLAGNATVTVKNERTGNRYTYKLTRPKPGESPMRFVKLLTRADNVEGFTYFANIKINGGTEYTGAERLQYFHGRKARISEQAPGVATFKWLLSFLVYGKPLPGFIQIWHEGRCARCGRKLTVPESIASGLGPECGRFVHLLNAEA